MYAVSPERGSFVTAVASTLSSPSSLIPRTPCPGPERKLTSETWAGRACLPYIVAVIDELADLMLVSPDDVESQDLLAFPHARETPAGPSGRLRERVQGETQSVTARADRQPVVLRNRAFGVFRTAHVFQEAPVERYGPDRLLAVPELEEPLDRIPVPSAGWNVVDAQGVRDPEVREERDGAPGVAAQHRQELVVGTQPHLRKVSDAAHAPQPAILRQEHVGVLVDDEILLVELFLLDLSPQDLRPPLVSVLLPHLPDLGLHKPPDPPRAREDAFDFREPGFLLAELAQHGLDLQARQAVEPEFEDGLGLRVVQAEFRLELLARIFAAIGLPDRAHRCVQIREQLPEPLEDVDPAFEEPAFVPETALHDLVPEVQELREERLQIHPRRHAHLRARLRVGAPRAAVRRLRHEAGQVDVEIALELRVLVEVRHHELGIGVPLELDHDPHVFGRLVADIHRLRQLPLGDELADRSHEGVLLDEVGYRGDDDAHGAALRFLHLVLAADPDRALPLFVDAPQLRPRIHDFPSRGEVRPLDRFHEVRDAEASIGDESLAGLRELREVVRRDVRGHADRDTHGSSVREKLRDPRRKDDRFLRAPIVVRAEVDRLLPDLLEELHGQREQARFRVAVGCRAVPIERPEVAVPVDERIPETEVLGHADQAFIDRDVSMRVVLPEHLAHDPRALERLRVRRKTQVVVHRVEDAPLDRFQAVAHVRQRPRRDDRDRVVEVAAPCRLVEGHFLDARSAARGLRPSASPSRPRASSLRHSSRLRISVAAPGGGSAAFPGPRPPEGRLDPRRRSGA